MAQQTISKIYDRLINTNVINERIYLTCSVQSISFDLKTKDIIGNVIQEWLGNWLTKNNYKWKEPSNTQSFPDFIINDNELLECKSFNINAGPGFDVANFKSYIDSLLIKPERLMADYIIIPYKEENKKFYIHDILVKNVWEITNKMSGQKNNLVTHQDKKGMIYNIRPSATFHKEDKKIFKSRLEFVQSLSKTIDYFSSQIIKDSSYKSGDEWFSMYSELFNSKYNSPL